MIKTGRQRSAEAGFTRSNPFDSPPKERKHLSRPLRASSEPEPVINAPDLRAELMGYDEDRGNVSSAASSFTTSNRRHYRNDFRDTGGLENQSVQELESYAVYKAEEVTKDVNNALKVAENIREDATKTLISLHQQGEQVTRVHLSAANIDHDLSVGEKLLGSLGGMFSKTWKPKKNRPIKGPMLSKDDSFIRRNGHLEQKERLGLLSNPRSESNFQRKYNTTEASSAFEKIEVEKSKQDDGLTDLSNILGQLKDMAIDMGSEIERQNKALGHLDDDVGELDYRMKGATRRGRGLLGK